jgi:hypothetical protein
MKKLVFLSFFIFMSIAYPSQGLASFEFKNIQVSDIENGSAKIKWFTPDQRTRGTIYFGENYDNLDRNIGYSVYDYYHETVLSGLLKNKTYYFKILAIDMSENREESFLQNFSTKGMKKDDLIKPQFIEQKIMQIMNNAAAIYWTTNEETSAVVYYGAEKEGLKNAAGFKSFQKEHELFIYKLNPGTKYNLRITAKDRAGNEINGKFFTFITSNYAGSGPDLSINNIKPLSFNEEFIFARRAVIKFETSLIAKSFIQYGNAPGKYKYKIVVSEFRNQNHQITLPDLEPDTAYYYKITAYDSFNGKKIITSELSFITGSLKKKFVNGSLVKDSGYKVYVISGSEKLWIETAEVFSKLGYKWDWIAKVDDAILREYKEGASIKKTNTHPDGTLVKYLNSGAVYLLEGKKKRPFSSAESFLKNGYIWDRIITISDGEKYNAGEYL